MQLAPTDPSTLIRADAPDRAGGPGLGFTASAALGGRLVRLARLAAAVHMAERAGGTDAAADQGLMPSFETSRGGAA